MTPGLPWDERAAAGDVPSVPAATVVLVRDGVADLEALMLRRTSKVAFGGMWVFPGGRVDPGDTDPDAPDDELAAARRAAVREAAEEAGLVVPLDALVPLSLWDPPPQAPRRYRTWFFVAPGPTTDVAVDGWEIEEHAWLTPAEALARQAAGEIELAPPTWVTLWRLAADAGSAPTADTGSARATDAGRVGRVLAAVSAREPEHFATRIVSDGDLVASLWQGDAGYEDGSLDRPGPRRRLWLAPGPWRPEWPGVRPGAPHGLSSGRPDT